MFGLFKRNPVAKLEAEYRRLLEEARDLQRNGDIQGFAAMTARADAVAKRIEAIEEGEG
jgi:hypothetical protein